MSRLTAIGAAVAALWAVAQGIDILRFEAAQAAAIASVANNGRLALKPWTGKTATAFAALETILLAPTDSEALDGLHRREGLLSELLRVRPMASRGWAWLAAMRNALAAPPVDVEAAFLMSVVTGPNEATTMAQRALLGLAMWDKASPETRMRASIDLCGLTVSDPSRLRLVLSAKSETARADIRGSLVANGCTVRTIGRLGL